MSYLRQGKYQFTILIIWMCLFCLSCVNAPFPKELILQHILTGVAVITLVIIQGVFQLNKISYTCFILFLCLHLVGARWIYSNVPYDEWCEQLFSFNLTEAFHWQRNHYDRLVHFSYGLLFTYPLFELAQNFDLKKSWCYYFAVEFIMASSMVYELIEWGVAVCMSPNAAERYNGQQGDIWDAHKDMLLALIGSIICIAIIGVLQRKYNSSSKLKV